MPLERFQPVMATGRNTYINEHMYQKVESDSYMVVAITGNGNTFIVRDVMIPQTK